MDALDADVLIYAAAPDHPLGEAIRALLLGDTSVQADGFACVGSTQLLPEVLTKPVRDGSQDEVEALTVLLARLDLRPVDEATASLAVALGAAYGLRSADAVHLATAVAAGADRFLTNNHRDFPRSIAEVQITYPGDLRSR